MTHAEYIAAIDAVIKARGRNEITLREAIARLRELKSGVTIGERKVKCERQAES